MGRNLTSLPLSKLNGGINRYDAQAEDDQIVDGLDVIEDDGFIRRRDGFQSIGTGPVFLLPAGQTIVTLVNSTNTVVGGGNIYNRQLNSTATDLGDSNNVYILVGADEQFDGVDWRHVTPPTSPTGHRRLGVDYWNGSAWVALGGIVDTTVARLLNGSNIWVQTLCKDGRISWHGSQISGWSTLTPSGSGASAKYYVRFHIYNGTTAAALTGTGALTLAAPGARAFLTEPINTIIPTRFKSGLQKVLVGADRKSRRGQELGAHLGFWSGIYGETEHAFYIEDEGAGVMGQISWPAHYRTAGTATWPGSWTLLTAASGTYGSSGNIVTKADQSYSWVVDATNHYNDQHRGAIIYEGLAPTGSITNSSTVLRGSFAHGAITGHRVNEWEHCRIRCTLNGDEGGTPVDQEREIVSNTATTLTYHPHFGTAPNETNTFNIIKPHSLVRFRRSTRAYEVDTNAADTVTVLDGSTSLYSSDVSSADQNKLVHWEVGREFLWKTPANSFWTAAFDIVTRKVIITNGSSGLLEYDGISVRPLAALSDSNDIRLQTWIGALPDVAREELQARSIAASTVRKVPPKGPYVTDFHGRLVVADGYFVKWSAPAPDNDIWPYLYETQIRDSENQNVTGIATLNDNLVAWTPSSIFTAPPADDLGLLSFRPIAQGIGFISHRSVKKISIGNSSALIGANADGVYIFNGAEPIAVLDDWKRVLPGGVNGRALSNAVATISKFRNEYYLAVPQAGSDVNNRILVFNYLTKKWFVWTAPWGGISALGTDVDEFGMERVLFGTRDGHIAVLNKRYTDDGDTVTGYAKSPLVSLVGGRTVAPIGLLVTAKEMGTSETLTVRSYLNKRATQTQSYDANFNDGAVVYGTATYNNAASLYANESFTTKRINLPAGTRSEQFQFELRGTNLWSFQGAEILFSPKGQRAK